MKTLAMSLAVASLAWAATAEALVPRPPVKKTGVELKVTASSDKFTIDYAGKTAKEYRQWLEEAQAQIQKGADVKLPPPPKVGLSLEFVNAGDKDTTIYVGGDYTLNLDLKGPAAITIKENAAYTDDIKRPTPVQVAAGKSHKITLDTLQCGFRGYGSKVYWAEPGEYTLTVTYSTRGEAGEGNSFKSNPLKIKVVEPGKKDPGEKPKIEIKPLPVQLVQPIQPRPNQPRPIEIRPLPVDPAPPLKPADDREKEPKKSPLQLSIELGKGADTVKLDPKEAVDLKKELDAILEDLKEKKTRGKIPAAAELDLTLVIKNTSDKDVDIYVGGDDTRVTLKLEGKGAVTAPYLVIQTTEFRLSKVVRLEPGKTHTIQLKSLEHGPRGVGNRWYWTEPGEYQLSATWQLGGAEGGKGPMLSSKPVKIKVEEKK